MFSKPLSHRYRLCRDQIRQSYRCLRELIVPPLRGSNLFEYDTFVLKRINPTVGIGSNIQLYCGAIDYLRRHTKAPRILIDLQSLPNTLIEEVEVGQVNGWDRLFYQPPNAHSERCDLSLDALIQSSSTLVIDDLEPFDRVCFEDLPHDAIAGRRINYWRAIYQSNIRVREDLREDVDAFFAAHFEPSDRILAVLCRGTDYTAQRPYGHPVQPSLQEIFEETQATVRQHNINKIFLSTEDADISRQFRSAFNSVTEFPGVTVSYNQGKLLYESFTGSQKLRIVQRYLRQIETISRCHHFIAGRCGGSLWAALHSSAKQFGHVKIWDLGVYR